MINWPELLPIVSVSLRVSGVALLISTALGVPLGLWLGLKRFAGRRLMIAAIYTGMEFPPVVIGLFVYVLLSRAGPLGRLALPFIPELFTIDAMIAAQTLLALPLVAGLTMSAVLAVDPALRQQLRALGATDRQIAWQLVREARGGIVLALIGGFGAVISEVGAVMLVGGNIQGSTRTLTTAIVLETSKGDFALALALGAMLLGIVFVINIVALRLQGKTLEA
jgi:tungstate transport system permease protein